MSDRESRTYIATPPGRIIEDQISDREMTREEVAVQMEISEKHLNRLINGDVVLTANIANKLEVVFGIPANFWLKYEAVYRDKLKKVQRENQMEDIAVQGVYIS